MDDTDKSFKTVDKWKTTEYQYHKYIDITLEKDKSKYYTTFYSKDLSECDECGGSLVKFDFGEVTCVICGLVHIDSSESTIWSHSYINTALPRTRLSEDEKKHNRNLKRLFKQGTISKEEFEDLKFKSPRKPFRHIYDNFDRSRKSFEEFRSWLIKQDALIKEKNIALGYFFQLQSMGYGFRGNKNHTKLDIFNYLLLEAKEKPVESRGRFRKLLNKCIPLSIPIIKPLKTHKQWLDYDNEVRQSKMGMHIQSQSEIIEICPK